MDANTTIQRRIRRLGGLKMNNEELQEKLEQLASAIDWIKTKLVDLQEEKGLAPVKTPYEVKVPEDIEDYYTVNRVGCIQKLNNESKFILENMYRRGLIFKTRAEAKQFDKERILINKFKDWAKKYNEGWTLDWEGDEKGSYNIRHVNQSKMLESFYSYYYLDFTKLPYFKSEEIAEQFIEEFGDEIKEVLY